MYKCLGPSPWFAHIGGSLISSEAVLQVCLFLFSISQFSTLSNKNSFKNRIHMYKITKKKTEKYRGEKSAQEW